MASGKVRVLVTSNARKVTLVYRTAKNHKRTATITIRKSKGLKKLPPGSHAIVARTRATSKLRASIRVPVVLQTPTIPTDPAPLPEIPPIASPPPPSAPLVARPGGPAGYGTEVSGLSCPAGPAGLIRVWVTTNPDQRIATYMWGTSNPTPSAITTPANQPLGLWRFTIDCRYVANPSDSSQVRAAVPVASYPFDLTINAPQPTLSANVAHALSGQTIQVTQAGDCGDYPTGSVNMWLSASDSSINPSPVYSPPFDPSGGWGPVSMALPSTPLAAGASYTITANCMSADQHSWVSYAPLTVPAGDQ